MPIHFQTFQDDPRFQRFQTFQRRVSGRPGWVWKTAAAAAVLVVVVPLVLLTVAAAVVGVAVFAVMSLAAAIARAFGDLFGGAGRPEPHAHVRRTSEHRENVRIIERP